MAMATHAVVAAADDAVSWLCVVSTARWVVMVATLLSTSLSSSESSPRAANAFLHVSMLVGCVCHGVQMVLVRFLDERLQVDPDLASRGLRIPLFENALVRAASERERESDGIVKKLRGSVGIVPPCLDLLTVLNSAEEDFRCIILGNTHFRRVCHSGGAHWASDNRTLQQVGPR